MVESVFGINHMKAWIHPSSTNQDVDDVMVCVSWHILDPLVSAEHHLNAIAYLSVVADKYVHSVPIF